VIALHDARALVLAEVPRLAPMTVPLAHALGCVTAADVTAAEDVPPFDNTAVDGFAVHAADVATVPVDLPVAGTLAAGGRPAPRLEPGTVLRIMTGAPMPEGADAVVMVEDSEPLDGGTRVRLRRSVAAGDAVRRAGDDVRAGDLVLPAGTVLRPAHLGVLASIGVVELAVVPRPRVGVLSTGDELVPGGLPLAPGQIRESNKAMLLGLVEQAGCIAVDLGLVRDDEVALLAALEEATVSCDALVTSGGVSMGDFDIVKAVLDRSARGGMRWMQIAIKPAKPFAFGLLGPQDTPVPVFGLPGNPVSSLVSFEVLARPALRQMAGHTVLDRTTVRAVADDGLPRRPDEKLHLVRVHGSFAPDGRLHVRSTGAQGSHQLASTAAANGLALVPDGDGVPPGGDVDVVLISD
jgi:molybdopterin molybdotransferase